MPQHILRLHPKDDLKKSIARFVQDNQIKAGWIITCVGSLTNYNIRFANKKEGTKGNGFFEILALTGTLALSGLHLHIMIADGDGKCIGGHLLDENLIYTTAEIVIGYEEGIEFLREPDPNTGFKELSIK